MKVAICISGHLRTFAQTFPAFRQHLLEVYDCDVFISTWNDIGLGSNRTRDDSAATFLETAGQLYQPVAMESENWSDVRSQWGDLSFLEARRRQDAYPERILGMWHKIWRANELKRSQEQRNGVAYDVVVRTRADVLHFESPELRSISSKHIYIGNKFGYGGIPDLFAFGSSRLMDAYASLFHRIPDYAQAGVTIHPETLLECHLLTNNPDGVIFSDIAFRLCRPPSTSPAPLITWGRRLE